MACFKPFQNKNYVVYLSSFLSGLWEVFSHSRLSHGKQTQSCLFDVFVFLLYTPLELVYSILQLSYLNGDFLSFLKPSTKKIFFVLSDF